MATKLKRPFTYVECQETSNASAWPTSRKVRKLNPINIYNNETDLHLWLLTKFDLNLSLNLNLSLSLPQHKRVMQLRKETEIDLIPMGMTEAF
mmetsp:Transcript_13735/g.17048  ORF Transcript_13735/g.17048 Transcript_13735/m.17048 type:complete len:93 (-) Transcript_13735:1322-1600(-)